MREQSFRHACCKAPPPTFNWQKPFVSDLLQELEEEQACQLLAHVIVRTKAILAEHVAGCPPVRRRRQPYSRQPYPLPAAELATKRSEGDGRGSRSSTDVRLQAAAARRLRAPQVRDVAHARVAEPAGRATDRRGGAVPRRPSECGVADHA